VNFTQLGKETACDCHIDGELFYAVTVAKKHYDTVLEQILDQYISKNLQQMFAV
jgi:phosphoribosylformylglycinamidine synthase subunit PurL